MTTLPNDTTPKPQIEFAVTEGGTVTATIAGNTHRLVWVRIGTGPAGQVFYDGGPNPMCACITELLFHTMVADHFGVATWAERGAA